MCIHCFSSIQLSQIQTIVHSSYSYDPWELNEHNLLLHQYLLEVSLGNLQESFKGFEGKTFFPLSTSNFYILFYIFFPITILFYISCIKSYATSLIKWKKIMFNNENAKWGYKITDISINSTVVCCMWYAWNIYIYLYPIMYLFF